MKYKGLLFDVDGVLVNSEKLRVNYFQKTFKERGVDVPDNFFNQIVGKSTPVFFREMVEKQVIDSNLAEKLLEEYNSVVKQNYPYNVELIKETVDFIEQYTGNSRIGIATVNTRNKALEVLGHLQINEAVKAVVSRDDVIKQKPDPECYIKLTKLLELDPTECAVIEDTVNGAKAGINAGIDCYVFLNSYNSKKEFEGLDIKRFISTTEDLESIAL